VPQLLLSVCKLMQPAPQQLWPAPQTIPQPPQLFGSVELLTHSLEQQPLGGNPGQWLPQEPQLVGSLVVLVQAKPLAVSAGQLV
jgi:hypothetical protein